MDHPSTFQGNFDVLELLCRPSVYFSYFSLLYMFVEIKKYFGRSHLITHQHSLKQVFSF